jgi:hypothetical protein
MTSEMDLSYEQYYMKAVSAGAVSAGEQNENQDEVKVEVLQLDYCTPSLTNIDEFECRVKENIPSGSRWLLSCEGPQEGTVWYTLLASLPEPQTINQAVAWLEKVTEQSVIGWPGGSVMDQVKLPDEGQTHSEFLLEGFLYIADFAVESFDRCRGNLRAKHVTESKRQKTTGLGTVTVHGRGERGKRYMRKCTIHCDE